MAPTSLEIVVRNNTNAANLFAYVTGRADSGLFFLTADGKTPYYPSSPSSTLQKLKQDCSIPVGGPGQSKTLTVPRLSGARIWFCEDQPLTFLLNPGPAVVEPAVTNTQDPNYNLNWAFCEFTLNADELYVNVSYVDFFSIPVSLKLENASGKVTRVAGMPQGALDTVCNQLVAQGKSDGAGWEKLVIKAKDGSNLRALSPNSGRVMFQGLFDGYYQPYVDSVWAKYQDTDLTVNTQFTWGDITGRIVNGKLTFGSDIAFGQPSAADIFSCDSGPFAHGANVTEQQLNIGARIAAAFNRSTLLVSSIQPEGEKVEEYYKEKITNHYSRICHTTSVGGRGYAFPYDDVGASNGEDQSGFLNDPNPKTLTIGVGIPL
ncbi:Glucan endo-1,3-beta-glucosidase-like protein [Cladobotryum mycophilum]|uniref:Glucan endo-1,3-beta-glucosidase-like protein n=1 Tax=Cladobotryum mycophilum TaxID=491253 RepID=A0ABR0S9C2_9HYPO